MNFKPSWRSTEPRHTSGYAAGGLLAPGNDGWFEGALRRHRDVFANRFHRRDLKKITIPVLIKHSVGDQIVPYANSAPVTSKLVKNGSLKPYGGGIPRAMPVTQMVNAEILKFLETRGVR
jgi:pimeloyl-ACP methyl ester carboxylesterase